MTKLKVLLVALSNRGTPPSYSSTIHTSRYVKNKNMSITEIPYCTLSSSVLQLLN